MSDRAELPNIAEVFGQVLQLVPPEHQPLLVAVAERLAAERYRGWAAQATDADQRARLLACSNREEEIARRVEALYPDASTIQADILTRNPALAEMNHALFAPYSLHQQWALQAQGERVGAATWRSFARKSDRPEWSAEFLACAPLEEDNAAVLESLLAAEWAR